MYVYNFLHKYLFGFRTYLDGLELQVQSGRGGGGRTGSDRGCSTSRYQQGDEAVGIRGQNVSERLGLFVFQETLQEDRAEPEPSQSGTNRTSYMLGGRLQADHEHPAPLGVVKRGLHHEQLHRLGRVAGQELDERLSEGTASLGGEEEVFKGTLTLIRSSDPDSILPR